MDKLILTDSAIVHALVDFISDCDADTLAAIAEDAFGGKIATDGETYILYPDDSYTGGLDKYGQTM